MIKLTEIYDVDGKIPKTDFVRYSSLGISTLNTCDFQIFIKKPLEESVVYLLISYLDLNFDVLHSAIGNRYANRNDIRLVVLSLLAFFSNFKLTISSGKQLEDSSHSHIVSLVYKLIAGAKNTVALSIDFAPDRGRR